MVRPVSDATIVLAEELLKSDPAPAALIDADGTLSAVNDAFAVQLGITTGRAPIANLENALFLAKRSRSSIPVGFMRPDRSRVRGTLTRLHSHSAGLFIARPKPAEQGAEFRQLTTHLQEIHTAISQKSLRESTLRHVLDAAVDGIAICDTAGRVRKKNSALVRMAGPVETLEELFRTPDWHEMIQSPSSQDDAAAVPPRPVSLLNGTTLTSAEFTVGYAQTVDGPLCILVFHDVSERDRLLAMERAMADADQEAKISKLRDEAKTRFLSMISHELRTPLHGVISALDLINAKTIHDPELADLLRIATVSSAAALEQVNRILEVTRLETRISAEKVQLGFAPFDVISTLIDEQHAFAARKGNTILHLIEGDRDAQVSGDPYLFRQIAQNLINNAIKFTQDGTITVEAKLVETDGIYRFVLRVTDTGMGFSMDQKDRLLKEFETGNDKYSRIEDGAGLGLALVVRAVEKMGGRLDVQSEEGRGSCFEVFLPFAKAEAVAKANVARMTPIGDTYSFSVLVVDDVDINRQVLSKTLQKFGCRIAEAVDGKDALQQMTSERFDLVFMDVSMPEMDGMEATRRYRAMMTQKPRLSIIGLTAHDDPFVAEQCVEAGMDFVEVKPLRVKRLAEILRAQLGATESPTQNPADFQRRQSLI